MERVLLDEKAVERTVNRITLEILEKNQGSKQLSLIGIRTRGIFLAKRMKDKIKEIENRELPLGVLDITMYRDDIAKLKGPLEVKKTDIPFNVNNMTIVLIDDVLYTGRTTRAAIDAIMDLGRPNKIQLAVLVDRGARELPIQPDYTGIFHTAAAEEEIWVKLREVDGKDEVLLSTK
ncbi:MAG: Bifunctional protein PyrR [Syntrophorhabdaceae bacterium PtaU1.Bin034]|jgi:pyrimidine operon attenuation protein/uracil phosphoribosyltransferase|nr:MAG: Bifunctional protein PyrR [Syntrophorhabdaceae bacterium PtaU1.Bin034]